MNINILGTNYTLTVTNEGEEPRLKNMDGFCDETSKEIVAEDYQTKIDEDSKKSFFFKQKKFFDMKLFMRFFLKAGFQKIVHGRKTRNLWTGLPCKARSS